MILGDVIKSWRKEHDVSLREASKQIGLNLNALHRLENGKIGDGENLVRVLTWLFLIQKPKTK